MDLNITGKGGSQKGFRKALVSFFGFLIERIVLKDSRFAAPAYAACGWTARHILRDRKVSAFSHPFFSRPNAVLCTPKNKKANFPS
jgi:hypothetical protein